MSIEPGAPNATDAKKFELFIIGGGINGCGIARDAAGRGLSVALAEMNDLGSATSSASTKLFHGGLRYLEYFEFRLVREALIEREQLLSAMPHISWPMRFVLPYHRDMRFDAETPASRTLTKLLPFLANRRPAWMIRLGLFLYDYIGRRRFLPGTATLDLRRDRVGDALQNRFRKAFEFSDCYVDDARLVVLNARDAAARGARIMTRTRVMSAIRKGSHWEIELEDQRRAGRIVVEAEALVNAAGPWVGDVIKTALDETASEQVRLVRGSHIVTRKLFDHDKAYFFQGGDGRIVFAIPFETDFTLIGTTEFDHDDPWQKPECTPEETRYLLKTISEYLQDPPDEKDVVWSFSGVRPLFDDGAPSATAATREYVLKLDDAGAPVCHVFGGKITTYRKLAEAVFAEIAPQIPWTGGNWTSGVPLPGGEFAVTGFDALVSDLRRDYPFLDAAWARRLMRSYGTEARMMLGEARDVSDLGRDFGQSVTAAELEWVVLKEWVETAEDFIWRRSKLGLRLSDEAVAQIDAYIKSRL